MYFKPPVLLTTGGNNGIGADKQKAGRGLPFDLEKDFLPLMGLLTGGPRFLSG